MAEMFVEQTEASTQMVKYFQHVYFHSDLQIAWSLNLHVFVPM
jgi:hypothetical protein